MMSSVDTAVEMHHRPGYGAGGEGEGEEEELVNVLVALGMQYGLAHLVGSNRLEGREGMRNRFQWGSNRALRGIWR